MAFIIIGAVQLIGFTTSGIAAGSTAAALMSTAGTVAAGSLVAVCQSIGATGAVSAATAVVANTAFGAAVAGTVAAVVRKHRRRKRNGNDGDVPDNSDDDTSGDDDPSDGDDKDGKDIGSDDKSDKVVSSSANKGDGRPTKGGNLGKFDRGINDDTSGIGRPSEDNGDDGDSTGEDHTGSGSKSDKVVSVGGNKTENARKLGKFGRPDRDSDGKGDSDRTCVSDPYDDNDGDNNNGYHIGIEIKGDKVVCNCNKRDRANSDRSDGINHGNSSDVFVADVEGGGQIGASDHGNEGGNTSVEDHADGDDKSDEVVDFGEPVYNSNDELCDPSTGEAIVEI